MNNAELYREVRKQVLEDIEAGDIPGCGPSTGEKTMSIIKSLHRVICDIEELQDAYAKADAHRAMAQVERDEAMDLLCDCAGQFLIGSEDGTITHSFMSTEERLCAFLVANGRMEQIGRAKFRLLPSAPRPAPNTAMDRQPPTGFSGDQQQSEATT
jgi:hypothetical protein